MIQEDTSGVAEREATGDMKRILLLLSVLAAFVPGQAHAVDRAAIDRAVERGVLALKRLQQADGSWAEASGATPLAGLALLESGVAKTDPAVRKAAAHVRAAGLTTTQTYNLALSVLFLDRLDEPSDTPLIESMIVRLLAGQQSSGAWSYACPGLGGDEVRRIQTEMTATRATRGGRTLRDLPARGKRTASDLPKEVQTQVATLSRIGPVVASAVGGGAGDNSNTQFATLALWVGRRYGVPTQRALLRLDAYFRATQNPDGGWTYQPAASVAGSTAAMTCAGVLALVCGHAAAVDLRQSKDATVEKADLSKDVQLRAGLLALSTAVGVPIGWKGDSPGHPLLHANGRAFYFLWSLERVCVGLQLDLLGRKNWYDWGAEIVLASQQADGSWQGDYGSYGADTAFALLFLRRSNLAADLTANVTGLKTTRILRAGGEEFRRVPLKTPGIGEHGPTRDPDTPPPATTPLQPPARADVRPPAVPPRTPASDLDDLPAAKLGDELVRASGADRAAVLARLRDGKGVAYTEALLAALPQLDVAGRNEARHALAERFSRMKDTTLRSYLQDTDAEVRRAAVLAIAARDARALVPDVIRCLSDRDPLVQKAARAALKELSGKDFGPEPDDPPARRQAAVAAWRRWWQQSSRE